MTSSPTAQERPMRVVDVKRAHAVPEAMRRIVQTEVVLDVGPGIQPQSFFRPRVHLCVEAHRPYIERLRSARPQDTSLVLLAGTWQELLPHLPDKSVDSAFAMDLIEHLPKQEGYALLRELGRIARIQI